MKEIHNFTVLKKLKLRLHFTYYMIRHFKVKKKYRKILLYIVVEENINITSLGNNLVGTD